MAEKKLVPELRFAEFDGEWKEVPLGSFLTFKNGVNASKEDYGSGYKFINVLDIIENNFITYDRIQGAVNIDPDIFEKNRVDYGDVLFQRSSETREEVGQANVYLDERPATFGGFVIRGRKISDYDPQYMNYLLRTPNSRKEIIARSGGSTRYNVGQSILSEVEVILTNIPEQQKIASFLSSVDERLRLLQQKKEKLERYKKGVMQKLFPKAGEKTPEIRFKDDNGKDFPEWEELFAKELFHSHSNKSHDGDLPILSASQKLGMIYRDQSGIEIQSSEKSVKSYKIVEPGDFVISLRSFQGGLDFSRLKGICSPAYTILKPSQPIANEFYMYYFKKERFISRLSKTVVGIRDGKQITYDAFGGLKIPYPSVAEQQRIASFLSSIDHSIEKLETDISGTEKFKKGLLQKMFV